jgi:hypothetical protein
VLEEKFTEDELKQLIAWLESPVNKKYQQLAPEMSNSLGQKLAAESRRRSIPSSGAAAEDAAALARAPVRPPPAAVEPPGKPRAWRASQPPAAAGGRQRVRDAKLPHAMAETSPPSHRALALRNQIDAVDRDLLALLNRRAALAQQVGEVKKQRGSVASAPSARRRSSTA